MRRKLKDHSARCRTMARCLALLMALMGTSGPATAQAPPALESPESPANRPSASAVPSDAPAPPLGVPSACASLAQSTADPTTAPTTEPPIPHDAAAEIKIGAVLSENADYEGALVRFKRAYEKSNHPAALEWVIATLQELHRYKEMRDSLDLLLAKPTGARSREDTEKQCKKAASLAVVIGALRVVATEPGAAVSIHEKTVGTTPLPEVARVDADREVELRVTKTGFKPFVWKGSVRGGREVTIRATLERDLHEAPLTVDPGRSGQIRIDGTSVGLARWTGVLPSGPHALLVTAPLKIPFSQDLTIEDHKPRTLTVSLVERVPAWVWVLGGTLLTGGMALGTAFLFRSPPTQGTLQPHYLDFSSGGQK